MLVPNFLRSLSLAPLALPGIRALRSLPNTTFHLYELQQYFTCTSRCAAYELSVFSNFSLLRQSIIFIIIALLLELDGDVTCIKPQPQPSTSSTFAPYILG
jgi:hypothetical protein